MDDPALSRLTEKLAAAEDFSPSGVERIFAAILQEFQLPMGKLAQPVRVALTGSTVSPGIHDVIAVLGRERTVRRLRSALARIS